MANGFLSFSNTADFSSFYQDLQDIREGFISFRDFWRAVFSFLGFETAVLLIIAFLFLFLIDLIPFFFFDKRQRYYIGIGFGVFFGIWRSYAVLSCLKFVGIMLIPPVFEALLLLLCRQMFVFGKKAGLFLWRKTVFFIKAAYLRSFKKNELSDSPDNEKN